MKLEISCTIVSLGDGLDMAVTQLASQVSRLKPTGLLCMGMDERTGLLCEGGNMRRMLSRILDAADRIRNSQRKLQ